MNILYILPSFSTVGGTAAKVLALVNASKCNSFAVGPNLVKDDNFFQDWEQANVSFFRYESPCSFWKRMNFVKNLIAKLEIHVIHTFFPEGMYIAVMCKMIYPHIKVVRSLEGPVKRKMLIRIASWAAFHCCNHIISISQYVKHYYKEYVKLAPNSVIYNCAYNIVQNSYAPLEHGVCRLLCVCGLNENKNIPLFPEIARELKNRDFAFHITICGEGPLREWLVEKIKEYKLENYFFLPGRVPRPQVYYKETDIYIHPADLEGFGLSVAEAMSAGLPVIVSDKGALPELIQNGKSGIVVNAYKAEEWAENILKLYEDKLYMLKLGNQAKQHYENRFAPSIYASKIDSLYDRLLN